MNIYPLTFGFSRPEQGVSIMEVKDLNLPGSFNQAPPARLAQISPGGWGGNHKHSRQEAFVACGPDLYIIWRDKKGRHHEEPMITTDGTRHVFIVDPWVPHMVVNKGSQPAILYEIMNHNDGQATSLTGTESLR